MARKIASSLRWLCLAYWGMVTILLLVPDPVGLLSLGLLDDVRGSSLDFRGADKVAHLLAYFGLAFFTLITGLLPWLFRREHLPFTIPFLAMAGFALTTETVQSFIPNRSCSLLDMITNFAGLALGVLLYLALRRIRGRSSQRPRDASEGQVAAESV